MKSSILLSGLELGVLLGWLPEERSREQTVVLDIQIHFRQPPLACHTDELVDTYCYDALTQLIKNHLQAREFKLIEYLSREIYDICKKHFSNAARIDIRLTKKPKIKNLTGGASFTYGDEETT